MAVNKNKKKKKPPKIPAGKNKKKDKLKSKKAELKPKKNFTIGSLSDDGDGEKVILYGKSGIGKTTLAALAPKPVYIAVDDGCRKIRDPKTGKELNAVKGIESFQDVRDVLQQPGVFDDYDTIIIDTGTKLEELAERHTIENVPHEKGKPINSLEDYGYGKGYKHNYDTMMLPLQDLDKLVRKGKNIVILCQNAAIKRANPGGEDFLEDGPKLYHPTNEKHSVRLTYCEWADHVARIAYYDFQVEESKAGGSTERAVFIQPEVYYFAKSRTIDEDVISFEDKTDDSFWKYLFNANNDGGDNE